ncbi:hypothetical protein LSCM1_05145 [Leishmania martiniquensis]|uniref:Uncharacterized protein n=1 Tax=Leishmania martiniquensis TaxID=1580590 RepID=A0A836HAD7_9TRYP|nr:hypothetical protein LSCM1_05145 [Leishmania martiniquensis]
MSDTGHGYAETGHTLSLPPKRQPSRQSCIVCLPTSRAEVGRAHIHATSPGRIETPHSGEPSVALQRASQVAYGSEAAHPPPQGSKQQAAPTAQGFSKVPSSVLAAPSTPQPAPPRSTELEFGDRSSRLASHVKCVSDANAKAPSASDCPREGGDATPPQSHVTAIIPELDTPSDKSPLPKRVNCLAAAEDDDEYKGGVPAPAIQLLSTKPTAAAVTGAHPTAAQSAVWSYSNSKEPGMYYRDLRRQAESTHSNPLKRELQQSRPRSASAAEGSARQEAPTSSEASSDRCGTHSARSSALPSPPAAAGLDLSQVHAQQKIDEPRVSKLRAAPNSASQHPLAPSHQPMNVATTPTTPRYSTRTSRNSEDPLEMNTPIAERARLISMSTSRGASQASEHARALEGTELLPGLPRLQGRRTNNDTDRSYRTITRFIAHQPEGERPGLEEMLANCVGHENELCSALGEAYSFDYELMKAGCHRRSVLPLLADRPLVGKSAAPSS